MSEGIPADARSAEELFVEWAREGAGAKAFESLCAAHPTTAQRLRELRAHWDALPSSARRASDDPALSERLRDRFGDVDPEVSLSAEDRPEPELHQRWTAQLREGASRYRVIGELARGGMGVILKVWDGDLRRALAMKVVLDGDFELGGSKPKVDAKMLGRFLEEAQITGQLDHPGIVPVHELGLDAQGRVYFTMRLVRGEDLRVIFEHVRNGFGGWNRTRALGVLLKVCEAMSFAHAKNVVHRDLKPANVMVGRFGEVYVMDWGLARVLGRADRHDLRLRADPASTLHEIRTVRRDMRDETPGSPLVTLDGDIVGTPSYMAPEQALGRLDFVGPRSDVYSVGAMLYQLLAGEMPYVPRDSRQSAHTTLAAVLQGPPRAIEEVAEDAPAELAAIVSRAMAREPAERYASMQALSDDLRAYLEGRVVAAYETGAWAETRKWIQRNRPLAAALAAVIATLAIGLSVSWAFKSKADARADEVQSKNAELEQANATIGERNASLARETHVAEENERLALARADDVLALSTSKDLEDLIAAADQLWPATPDHIRELERWLADAHALVDGRPADPAHSIKRRPSLDEHRAKLAELRARARPLSAADRESDRRASPRFEEWKSKSAELEWRSRMLGLAPWPTEASVEASLPKTTDSLSGEALNAAAWRSVDPALRLYGEETRALHLARRALQVLAPEKQWMAFDTLAWALFELGRIDDSREAIERALVGVNEQSREVEGQSAAQLKASIANWSGDAVLVERRRERDQLAAQVSALEEEVNRRRTFEFDDAETRWWATQLAKLVAELEAFADPRNGLMSEGVGDPFGWGVAKRLAFARTISERSVSGVDAARRWKEAADSIASSPRYRGLQLKPQIGLLPLGADAASGLWEFADLLSGDPPARGTDGHWVIEDTTGVVLVLLPGGTFTMGAQRSAPSEPNFDPRANRDEVPVHDVELSPFFIAKYETTQGQWLGATGSNPSRYGPTDTTGNRAHSLRHPVEQVSWNQCVRVTARLGLSLPSESQWEYAARAGTSTPWWCGAEPDSVRDKANIADVTFVKCGGPKLIADELPGYDDGWASHSPVGTFAPNPFGLCDVIGNVYEWCLDGKGPAGYVVPVDKDPVAPVMAENIHIIRGGSFLDPPSTARASDRENSPPDHQGADVGFRAARSIDP